MPNEAMLEAHVQFEVAAWTDDLTGTLQTEIAELFGWLEAVPIGEAVTTENMLAAVDGLPVTDETFETVAHAIRSVHESALDDETTLADLVRREDYDRIAESVIGMTGVQEAAIDQVTSSEVYSQLIAHVLYHGIKNYAMTESPVVRRLPGASSLMRFGQSAMDTAAPNLSKGIDRQLTAFVNANIQDTLRESRDYLSSAVDEEVMKQVADEIWDSNADATVSRAAALLPTETLNEIAEIARGAWEHLRTTSEFRRQLEAVVEDFLSRNADRTVADLLVEAGVTQAYVVEQAEPWMSRAAQDGYLEARIRARLEAFYTSYRPRKAARRNVTG